jgi:hypothetical protein
MPINLIPKLRYVNLTDGKINFCHQTSYDRRKIAWKILKTACPNDC